jgi:hypothetical protein
MQLKLRSKKFLNRSYGVKLSDVLNGLEMDAKRTVKKWQEFNV